MYIFYKELLIRFYMYFCSHCYSYISYILYLFFIAKYKNGRIIDTFSLLKTFNPNKLCDGNHFNILLLSCID